MHKVIIVISLIWLNKTKYWINLYHVFKVILFLKLKWIMYRLNLSMFIVDHVFMFAITYSLYLYFISFRWFSFIQVVKKIWKTRVIDCICFKYVGCHELSQRFSSYQNKFGQQHKENIETSSGAPHINILIRLFVFSHSDLAVF